MRALITGQIGLDKKQYLDTVARIAKNNGEDLQIYHIGVLDRTLAALVHLLRAHVPLPPPISDRVHQLITEVIKPIRSGK